MKWAQLLMFPLIAFDCIVNMLIGGSWRNTLSAEAWRHREHKHWGWCQAFIDVLFFWQPDHCKDQDRKETEHGSVWKAWWIKFNGGNP